MMAFTRLTQILSNNRSLAKEAATLKSFPGTKFDDVRHFLVRRRRRQRQATKIGLTGKASSSQEGLS